jgi:hypothetical protein
MSNEDPPYIPELVQKPEFWQHDYLPPGETIAVRAVYSSLPAIILTNELCTDERGLVVVVAKEKHLVVHADVVYVLGTLGLPGRNVKIVAKKLGFSGSDAAHSGIDTSGISGSLPLDTAATIKSSKPPHAADGKVLNVGKSNQTCIRGEPGVPGGTAPATRAEDGAHGAWGTSAGDIDICVDVIEGIGRLSANGGTGHAAQDGQWGQDGGDGGHGAQRSITMPSTGHSSGSTIYVNADAGPGGPGGEAGRGGAGGSGGDAGQITVRTCKPLPATLTIEAKPGAAGEHGAHGVGGVGGWSGRPPGSSDETQLGLPVEFEIAGGPGPLAHGSTIRLKTREKKVGDYNTLSAFSGQRDCYYYTDGYDAKTQGWEIEHIDLPWSDRSFRYGDAVTFKNLSFVGQYLCAEGDYLTTSTTSKDQWALVAPSNKRQGDPIQYGDTVILRSGGRAISDADPGASWWFPILANPKVAQARNGELRNPEGRDPRDDRKAGVAKPFVRETISLLTLAKAWHPAQAWLQVERLNAILLTLELNGADDDAFLTTLTEWQELFASCTQEGFGAVRARINRMVANIALELDAFGYQRDFAPNLSYAFYDASLTKQTTRLKALEESSAAVFSEVALAKSFRQKATIAFNEASTQRSVAKDRLDDALRAFATAKRNLEETSRVVEECKKPLLPENVKAFTQEIAETFNGCDLKSILEGLTMMAFAPPAGKEPSGKGSKFALSGSGALMAGVQLASYLQNGIETVQDAYGVSVNKQEVFTKVEGLGEDLFNSARDIFNRPDGQKLDLRGTGILATLDQWEKLVKQFAVLRTAAPLAAHIKALKEATQARGSAVVSYNIAVRDILEENQLIADNDRVMTDSIEKLSDGNDPALPERLSFLARQLQEQRDSIIELVYLANRAYAYWRLDDWSAAPGGKRSGRNVFRDVMQTGAGCTYAVVDSKVLQSCQSKLYDWYYHDLSSSPGKAEPFPTSADTDGFQIFIKDKAKMAEFREVRNLFGRKVHYTQVKLSPDGQEGSFTCPELARLYDVRLTRFRVFVLGAYRDVVAKADAKETANLFVEFLPDSREETFTAQGDLRVFSRPSLEPKFFRYDGTRGARRYMEDEPDCLARGFIHTDGDIGCGALDDVSVGGTKSLYAGISPFTTWTIIVDPAANPNLVLGDDLSFEIQLLGSARTRL